MVEKKRGALCFDFKMTDQVFSRPPEFALEMAGYPDWFPLHTVFYSNSNEALDLSKHSAALSIALKRKAAWLSDCEIDEPFEWQESLLSAEQSYRE
jgi:hypothetical protein